MEKNFKPVDLEELSEYARLWAETPVHSLDYTFTNLWGWQEYYGLEWRLEKDLCWIRQTRPQKLMWAPVGDWNAAGWDAIFSEPTEDEPLKFTRVPEALVQLWSDALPRRTIAEEDRGQWEYLYSVQELAGLSGKRFHKKKNHYNAYVNTYGEPDYRPLDERSAKAVLGMQDDWCRCHECDDSPSLTAENEAIKKIVANWQKFGHLLGGCLYIDGQMAAFSIGEKLDEKTLGVHFEKGLTRYKGIYQTINCQFARHAGLGFTYLNRAQDLDEEGLRQAKLTYHPVEFLRKYRVELL